MFVERFMAWSVQAGADQRVVAIRQLAETYLSETIAPQDLAATEQVFTLYLNDPSVKVRAAMAAALAPGESVPRHIVWSLCEDVCEVAQEMFRASPALRTADIVHAIGNRDTLVRVAIGERELLCADGARCLAEHGCERSVLALLENESVELSLKLKHSIALRMGTDADIRAHLLADEAVLPATRQILTGHLSTALLALAEGNGWGSSKRLAQTVADATNRVTVDIAMHSAHMEIEDYVAHLCETDQLTPALLVRAVCSGNAALFEAAIARLSGASLSRVQSIVDEARVSAFTALYARTGLPQSAYPVFAAAITAWQSDCADDEILGEIISKAEMDPGVDGALLAMVGRMACEIHRENAKTYERQLLLAA